MPSYFFHVKSAEKLKAYFYIWTTVRRVFVARHAQSGFASFDIALTAQEWRDVLSGVYFKCRNVFKGKKYDPTVDRRFDIATFWEFGGPLVFGADDDPTEDKTPLCKDGTKLQPSEFESGRLKAFMLWDLSILHCQVQLDRADVLLFDPSSSEPQQALIRIEARCTLFRPDGCNLSLTMCPWDNLDPSVRKPWFNKFQTILCAWPNFEAAVHQIHGLRDARDRAKFIASSGLVDLDALLAPDYEEFEAAMIYVYYQGVVDALGRMPIVPFKRPTYVPDLQRFMTI
ncbi:hypothetical protein FB451DRAFT_1398221 [Mycena latifolia]|nr:hypothetical protein FB451DRAFT_1398221 [Mycena latifolia]